MESKAFDSLRSLSPFIASFDFGFAYAQDDMADYRRAVRTLLMRTR